MTKSQNDEVPQCLDGAKPKAHPNAPPFKIAAGMTCFMDSTAKIGICDSLTLKAIGIARKNGRPEDIQGWVCPNDPDPGRRFENPCDKVDTEGKLQTCGLDQWIEAIGGCEDIKVKYGNNHKKAAEECQKRWLVSDTSWMAQGPCALTPEAGGIGAVIKVTGSGCKVMSCPSDGRIPLATGCVTRVLGQKN